MNYLAHLYFAADTPESRVANLMGDFVRGRLQPHWRHELRQGIWLHRQIDAYTDRHPRFVRARRRISTRHRRLSGVIVDLCFDHFLSRHWDRFSGIRREQFIQQVYGDLRDYRGYRPTSMERVLELMPEQDWLSAYHQVQGVSLALERMARRLRQPELLRGAGVELEHHYRGLEQDFLAFFPEVEAHVRQLKRSATYLNGGLAPEG